MHTTLNVFYILCLFFMLYASGSIFEIIFYFLWHNKIKISFQGSKNLFLLTIVYSIFSFFLISFLHLFIIMKGNFFYKRLGERIISERKKKKISQDRLAIAADIDRTYMVRIEKGKANPSIKVLRKITTVLKIKLSSLFRGV